MNMTEENEIIADKIVQLNKEYKSKLVSQDFQILRPYMRSMETIAILETIKPSSQPFALLLVLGSLGVFKSDSLFGFIGPSIEKILDSVSETIKALYPQKSIGQHKLLMDGVTLTITLSIALAGIGENYSFAHSLFEEDVQQEIDAFALELLTHIGVYSSTVFYTYEALVENAGYPNIIVDFFTVLTIFAAIASSSQKEILWVGLSDRLKIHLEKIDIGLQKLVAEKRIEFDTCNRMIVIIKQALLTIESNDSERIVDIVEKVLTLCGTTNTDFETDVQDIKLHAIKILGLLKQGGEEDLNMVTGLWQTG